jgi:hypothetical protein
MSVAPVYGISLDPGGFSSEKIPAWTSVAENGSTTDGSGGGEESCGI